ncbi:siroheme synthase [Rhizobium sp. Root73]|uniref:siroheme synthase CysG n=1 Tax=unclassified Rhizobium TaxID=2613769 RepID=UPI000728B2F2|nr:MULTISPECIES: siroheme synthase CysG [unclassified Rhizobium]KQY16846.1 siroheme synthase [Rhizobium sp. Root1334]KRC11401.1 siroheme synthase [Rhizobium sp. Root73]
MDVLQLLPNETASRAAPARMAPLAALPVFWSLSGKRAVVAGGTDAAAWKAELLAACGAEVHVYAKDLSETFSNLLHEGPQSGEGCFVHHPHDWHAGSFEHAALSIADCADDEAAAAFFAAAKKAGVPANVIDKPRYCQIQFGSIVNRSPVVVAISTGGAAPILAQAIRRRIETLLPQSLKSWGALAHSIRDQINATIGTAAARRAFWEAFVDRAFGGDPKAGTKADLLADAGCILAAGQSSSVGRVTLVGAGPGDAGLLTLKAVRALQAADVILFDDLVSDEVLELARREAKRMLVGKRGGRTSCKQEDINATMVQLAKAGKHVVRLKSGDPMIFGRAGEEIACLQQQGIQVDTVPGITSASAMAARLGVSLTHRDHAHAVRFITGHSRQGSLPADIDWHDLAQSRTTTIFYMGGRTAGQIRTRLLEAGMDADMPVAIVSAVTRSNEARWIGCLDDLACAVARIGVDNPILIGVGHVFSQTAYAAKTTAVPQRSVSFQPVRASI